MKDLKVAVLGIFHKEAFMIPYYQAYYGNLFGNENIYALGDPASDWALSMFNKANFILLNAEFQGHHKLHCETVPKIQNQLLEIYDIVIFAEADEFIVPDPEKYTDLKDFLLKNKDDHFTVQGYNVIHDVNSEPPLDPRLPLLKQRKYWYKHGGINGGGESKLLITRKGNVWYDAGFHWSNPCIPEHPDLYNFHLKQIDFDIRNSRVKVRYDTNLPIHSDLHIFSRENTFDSELLNTHLDQFNSSNVELIPEKFKNILIV